MQLLRLGVKATGIQTATREDANPKSTVHAEETVIFFHHWYIRQILRVKNVPFILRCSQQFIGFVSISTF